MNRPIEFCRHLAIAILDGSKTTSHKPLSTAELATLAAGRTPRCPFGVAGDTLTLLRWRKSGQSVVLVSEDLDSDQEKRCPYPRIELAVLETSIVKLHDVTDEIAGTAGLKPPTRAEFQRQWSGTYRGPQAWEQNPACWLVRFALRA